MKKKEHHGAKIEVTKDDPYPVSGVCRAVNDGSKRMTNRMTLCRCASPPISLFCDGSHAA